MKRNRLTTFVLTAAATAALSFGQAPAGKKSHVFKGKVEGVNATAGTLKVNNEKVDGWMDPMTMDYKVDNPEILKTVKAGDSITATVYDDDMVLHKVAKK